ncbi:hypothetical protein [Aquabacter spiritensis]|uniref:Protein-tyrosine-phosphatase n=1 Tax=Aquabacter spiritensis TaxID=933073 RepID=A0A4R3LLT0_9HYPH|nr:hypothetical protein [Aquabacter spiritensis]TCT00556.1 protein-tyrosine-phosphatase [Aquabacter spiritensis]
MPAATPFPLSVLFACRDNGGLSLLAEAIANARAQGLRAFSAGVAPGAVDLAAVECLHAARVPADGLSAKPLDLFSLTGAPRIHLVVSLVPCADRAARSFAARTGGVSHQSWNFEDVSAIDDIHARRLAYRRLQPDLSAAIGDLTRRRAA